jgi:small subunit ribosomal protein S6
MMRIYENVLIVRPDVEEEQIDQIVEQFRGLITGGGGTLDEVDKWGKRRLAYRIGKYEEGYYVVLRFTSGASPSIS